MLEEIRIQNFAIIDSIDLSFTSGLNVITGETGAGKSIIIDAVELLLGGKADAPIGALAHRKGTQDPWILDIVVGDARNGEILKHREIGTSRCKPESLADKAFSGILGKGARKFLYNQ